MIEGHLRKKSNRNTFWSSRYFILQGLELVYYHKEPSLQEKQEPRYSFMLQSGCSVSEIKQQTSRTKNRVLYCFKLQWPGAIADPKEDALKEDANGKLLDESLELPSHINAPPPLIPARGISQRGNSFTQGRDREPSLSVSFPPGEQAGFTPPPPSSAKRSSSGTSEFSLAPPPELDHPPRQEKHAKVGPFVGTDVLLQRRGSLTGMGAGYSLMSTIFEENETLQQLLKVKTSAATLKQHQEDVRKAQEDLAEKKKKKKKLSKKSTAGIAALAVSGVVVGAATAGIGLAAGLVVVGISAAAGGGAAAYRASQPSDGTPKVPNTLHLGSDSIEEAQAWKEALEKQIKLCDELGFDGTGGFTGAVSGGPTPQTVLVGLELWKNIDYWVSSEIIQGLRIFDPHPDQAHMLDLPVKRAELVVQSSPFETFMCIMSSPNTTLCGIIESMRVVHTFDDHSDIIHLCLCTQFISPTWTAPRDFCLSRFWKLDDDGNYTVFWDSVNHKDCPPVAGYVRGQLHGVFIVSPMKCVSSESDSSECLVTQIMQMAPAGWMWHRFGFASKYTSALLSNIIDVRDVMQRERFTAARPDGRSSLGQIHAYDSTRSTPVNGKDMNGLDSEPAPMNPTMWGEPEGTSFSVRGPTYITDKIKIASQECLFYLITVDFFELPQPMKHIASHPQNRIQIAKAKAKGPHPFIFLIQIQIPGPPHYTFCAYFTPVDPTLFEKDTPFTRIAKPFFFGDDDNFRDHRFKLIPQMIEANYVVKKATGNTPAIIGTKLKQHYFKGPNYFELDLDVASSSIAARITRLAVGYSKTVIVDIGFVLQGNSSEELPEQMMCAVRSKNLDVTHATPLS